MPLVGCSRERGHDGACWVEHLAWCGNSLMLQRNSHACAGSRAKQSRRGQCGLLGHEEYILFTRTCVSVSLRRRRDAGGPTGCHVICVSPRLRPSRRRLKLRRGETQEGPLLLGCTPADALRCTVTVRCLHAPRVRSRARRARAAAAADERVAAVADEDSCPSGPRTAVRAARRTWWTRRARKPQRPSPACGREGARCAAPAPASGVDDGKVRESFKRSTGRQRRAGETLRAETRTACAGRTSAGVRALARLRGAG